MRVVKLLILISMIKYLHGKYLAYKERLSIDRLVRMYSKQLFVGDSIAISGDSIFLSYFPEYREDILRSIIVVTTRLLCTDGRYQFLFMLSLVKKHPLGKYKEYFKSIELFIFEEDAMLYLECRAREELLGVS